jgi:hypothetical protein
MILRQTRRMGATRARLTRGWWTYALTLSFIGTQMD